MKRFLIPLALVILPATLGAREAAATETAPPTEAAAAATQGPAENNTRSETAMIPPPPPGRYASSTLIPRFDVMGQGRMRRVAPPEPWGGAPWFYPTTDIPCRRGYAPPPWMRPYGPWEPGPGEGFAGWERRPPGGWNGGPWGPPPPPVMGRR